MSDIDEHWGGPLVIAPVAAEAPPRPKIEPPPDGTRLILPKDEDALLELLLVMAAENAVFVPDIDKAKAQIKRGSEFKGAIIGLIESDGKLVASVGLDVTQLWYTQEWTLVDFWMFVHPDYRDGPEHFEKLIEFVIWASRVMRLPLMLGVVSGLATEAKLRLMRTKFKQIGGLFFAPAPKVDGAP